MKSKYAKILYVCCLIPTALWGITLSPLSAANSDEYSRHTITVETYEREGTPHVTAKMLVAFTPKYFLDLVSLSNENCAWIDKCVSVTVSSKTSTQQPLIQTHINAPWPFKDRDMVVTSRSKYEQTSNTLTIIIEDASNDLPQQANLVRMTQVHGEWQIKPHALSSEHLYEPLFELSYTGTANPNGNIPRSFALRFLRDSTQRTFENLQTLEQSKASQ